MALNPDDDDLARAIALSAAEEAERQRQQRVLREIMPPELLRQVTVARINQPTAPPSSKALKVFKEKKQPRTAEVAAETTPSGYFNWKSDASGSSSTQQQGSYSTVASPVADYPSHIPTTPISAFQFNSNHDVSLSASAATPTEPQPKAHAYSEDTSWMFRPSKTQSKVGRRCTWTWTVPKIIGIVVSIIVLIVIAVIIYYFYPRFPTIYINDIETNSLNHAYEFLPDDPSLNPPNLNAFQFKLHLQMNISVYNSNPYSLVFDSINVTAIMHVNTTTVNVMKSIPAPILNMLDYIGPFAYPSGPDGYKLCTPSYDFVLGAGTVGNIHFSARSNSTFLMNFTVIYRPDPCLGMMRDPGFQEVMQVCQISQQYDSRRSTLVQYRSVSTMGWLQSFGYNPELDSHVRIKCPVQQEQIASAIRFAQYNKTLTSVQILQMVFNDRLILEDSGNGDSGDTSNSTVANAISR